MHAPHRTFEIPPRDITTMEKTVSPKMKMPLNRKLALAFGSAILALFAVGMISYRGLAVSSESGQWVRHTHEVIENLQDLLAAMEVVESSARGFVLTGDESYLASYQSSVAIT